MSDDALKMRGPVHSLCKCDAPVTLCSNLLDGAGPVWVTCERCGESFGAMRYGNMSADPLVKTLKFEFFRNPTDPE